MDAPQQFNPMTVLHKAGVRSRHAHIAGLASVVLAFGTWLASRKTEDQRSQSDRWGLFIGEWAPTFFAIGIALRQEEGDDTGEHA